MKFKDKVVWITGASSGIGEGLAHAFAREGAKLVLHSLTLEELDTVAGHCRQNDVDHMPLAFDLSGANDYPGLVKQVTDRYGKIDVLINNAGVSQRALAHETLSGVDRKIFEINFFSAVELTKAVLPVHFAGRCCDMDPILEIAGKYDLLVIEDCAHAIESEYHGKKSGMFGDIGCFSFYVTKNIITGEGGMVLTDDDRFAARIKILALHGMAQDAWKRFADEGYKHYQVIHAGYKYNMMDIQAAIGIHQLQRVNLYWKKRQQLWQKYNEAFSDLPCMLPIIAEDDTKHAYHLYTPLIDIDKIGKSRDWVLAALTAENIGVGVHYLPVYSHPFYRKTFGWKEVQFLNAEWIGTRTISLPFSPALNGQDIEDVIGAFRKVLHS